MAHTILENLDKVRKMDMVSSMIIWETSSKKADGWTTNLKMIELFYLYMWF